MPPQNPVFILTPVLAQSLCVVIVRELFEGWDHETFSGGGMDGGWWILLLL